MRQLLVLLTLTLVSVFAVAEGEPASLPTVPHVDLNRYLGKWYEVATIPQFFQRKCVANTMAEYTLGENELINVTNTCTDKSGESITAKGAAKVVDKNSYSKLKVTFVKFVNWVFAFGGDYWIIDLDPAYRFAVVGHPDRTYAWVLAREPFLSLDELAAINTRLVKNGYDTCKLLMSIQDGGNQEKRPLCTIF